MDTLKICQTTGSPPRPEASENDGEAVPMDSSHKQLMGEGAIQHERFVFGAENGIIASSSSLENTLIMQRSERDQRKTENGIAYKDLEHHFGIRTLSETAEILEVSRSTLKRVCRNYGIFRWPSCRRNKRNGLPLPSNLRRGIEFSRLEVPVPESSRRESVYSDIPPLQVTTSVAHTIPDTAVMQDVNNMTIKATYNGLVIKFQDDEGEWILIACDEDVQECMGSSRSLKKTTIRMVIEQAITN